MGELVLFVAATDSYGVELWRTDGTNEGTWLVRDINPGSNSAYPVDFINLNGTVFFRASDGLTGNQLWKTNGSTAEVALANNQIISIKKIDTLMYFISSDGYSLWRSDGTTSGTFKITDTRVLNTVEISKLGDDLYFAGYDQDSYIELWKIDDSPNGATLVKDIYPGIISSNPKYITTSVNQLLFVADDGIHGNELWKSDGTSNGTQLVKDIFVLGYHSYPQNLTPIGDKVVFTAYHPDHGRELWVSDGTAAGTKLLKDIKPGGASTWPESDLYFFSAATSNYLYFNASGGNGDYHLWRTDGTPEGTVKLSDIQIPLWNPAIVGETLYAGGEKIWKLDNCGAYQVGEVKGLGVGNQMALAGTNLISSIGPESRRIISYNILNDPQFPLSKPVISFDNTVPNVLRSNVRYGNRWYTNNELIEHAEADTLVFDVSASADYTVKTVLGDCESEMSDPLIYTEVSEINEIEVFPNPVQDRLYIKTNIENPIQLHVYNSTGCLVESKYFYEESNTLDFSRFATGVYFLRIKNQNGGTRTKPIIKN